MSSCPFQHSGTVDARPREERGSEWDPAVEESFGSAQTEYRQLRETKPFPWSGSYGGFWAATTYADIVAIAQDERFITSVQNVVPHVPRSSRRPPLHFDPPEHTAYREAIDPIFRASSLKPHTERFRASAAELIDAMLAAEEPDGAVGFAAPYAVDCFAAILGVEAGLVQHVRDVGVRYSFAIQDMDDALIQELSAELYEIARSIYDARAELDLDPTLDLVAGLRRAVLDPENTITEKTAVATIRQMIVAGMGAPTAVLGSIVTHLAMDQELQGRLRADAALIPTAIEELLRLHSPYRVFARTPKEDVVVHGRLVREGEPIALIFPSGNRDEEVFSDPDDFVMHRKGNSHLSFGRGAHRCPAAGMGRLQLRIAVEELLRRTDSFGLAGEVVMMNWLEYGPRSVPLELVPVT